MSLAETVGMAVRILLIVILVILSVYDIKNRGVPIAGIIILSALMVIYLVFRCVYTVNDTGTYEADVAAGISKAESVKNILVTFAIGLLPGLFQIAISLITRKSGMADGILLCVIGGMENYVCGMVTWAAGSLLTAMVAIVLLCLKKVNRNTKMPFIPFLTTGYLFEITVFGI